MTLAWLAIALLPALLALAAIHALLRSPAARRLLDRPNERSLHVTPTPRVGGLGILIAAAPFAILGADAPLLVMLGAAGVLAVVSARDDLRSLPVALRLAAHLAAAAVAVAAGGATWPMAWQVAAVFAIAWMTNLFNFMDGADGLAGTMAVIGFATLALNAFWASALPLAAVCAAIASACAGFLAFNFPPARVFMGDAGSIPLGFLAGALGLHGALAGAWPLWFAPLVFAPFIADASVTLARRLARGERAWVAHRSHYYQRLVLSGWSARCLVRASGLLMSACALCATLARATEGSERWAIIAFASMGTLIALALIDFRLARGRVNNKKTPEP